MEGFREFFRSIKGKLGAKPEIKPSLTVVPPLKETEDNVVVDIDSPLPGTPEERQRAKTRHPASHTARDEAELIAFPTKLAQDWQNGTPGSTPLEQLQKRVEPIPLRRSVRKPPETST